MRNRLNQDIRAGDMVTISLPRGGRQFATIQSICPIDEFARAYGRQVRLTDGTSVGIDDCTPVASAHRIDVMARHYIIACLWADSPEGTRPRATRQAHEFALRQCRAFVQAIGANRFSRAMACEGYGSHPDCGNDEPACAAMGHDLYLTSRGHGVGFWAREELGELGAELSEFCGWQTPIPEPYPEFYRGWLTFTGGVKP